MSEASFSGLEPPEALCGAKGYSHSCFLPCLSTKRPFHMLAIDFSPLPVEEKAVS